jgi:GntR family transcriptional regulator of arabinose operon
LNEKIKPKHEQLKQEILRWIHSGRFQPNDQLPTEHEIAQLSGMSRQTVRQSIGTLVQEGWLFRKQGSGTFVSGGPDRKASDTATIGVMTTYISDYIFPQIVRGMESMLRSNGYHMLLSSTDNDKAKERENLQMLMSSSIQGLIIEPTKSAQGNPNLDCYSALNEMRIPYLMINERYAELDCPCVKVDDEYGGYLAAKHLIERGHRRIAGFFKTDDLQGTQRLRGFLRAHDEVQLPVLPELIVHYTTEDRHTKPYESAIAMLAHLPGRPTAFVAYNDELTVHLLQAARQLGLQVPEDLSVVGFDDSFLATATETKLTSVTHPKEELGVRAAQMVIAMIEGLTSANFEDLVFRPELVVRESTKSIL